jgi:D-sedoheptulose 7-phosphate isomerase
LKTKHDIDKISRIFDDSIKTIQQSKTLNKEISTIVKQILISIREGGKIVAIGNGGSAADSQHFVAEFIGRFQKERKSIPALALTTDTSILTALGNDYGFEFVFSRQCESMVNKNDIIFAITTSGKSANILECVQIAKKNGAYVVGVTGKNRKELDKYSDIVLSIPSNSTPRIQEAHRVILHIICELTELNFK